MVGFQEILNSGSVIIASLTAMYGINEWRRESRWKRKYELAEEVMVLVYEARHAIRIMRNPWQTEIIGEKDKTFRSLKIIEERFEKNKEVFAKLNSLKFRFMVIHDEKSEQLFEKVDAIVTEIFKAAWLLDTQYYKEYEKLGDRQDEEEKQKILDKMHYYESIIWATGENDPFEEKLKVMVNDFNNKCATVIKKKSVFKFKWPFY